ncbi:MAG: hypothetical protein M3Y73_10590 [Actinomycetota bacterium]|nr:hypothetical protein [Actinomycetota bacterium]
MANADVPSGTFTPSPSSGSNISVVTGTTNGTCDAPSPDPTNDPVDGYNAVIVGPTFPKKPPAEPDGHQIVATSNVGFTTTDPITVTFRKNFRDLATEEGTPLMPGDYVVTIRCVDQFNGTIFQTFSATFHMTSSTGGNVADQYTVTGQPPGSPSASPSPSASASPSASPTSTPTTTSDNATSTPETSASGAAGATTSSDPSAGTQPVASTGNLANTGAPIAFLFLGGLILLAVGLGTIVWLKRPRKADVSGGSDTSER